SVQLNTCVGPVRAGSGRSAGFISRAHASDLRASSNRPFCSSHRGDSGTHTRTSRVTTAGIVPIAKRPRQPTYGVRVEASTDAATSPSGTADVTTPLIAPLFDPGTNS